MAWWKEYILSVIGCVLFCGIIRHLLSVSRYKKMIHLVCGTLTAIVLMGPLVSIDLPDDVKIETEMFSPERYVDIGREEARKAQEQCITQACETYISNKANYLGLEVIPKVVLNEEMEPCFVQIVGQADVELQCELETLLEEDLGITKGNKVWIWNQEKDSS